LRPSCLPVARMVGVSRARAKSKAHRGPFKGSGGLPLIPSVGDLAIVLGEVGVIQVQMGRLRWGRPGSGIVRFPGFSGAGASGRCLAALPVRLGLWSASSLCRTWGIALGQLSPATQNQGTPLDPPALGLFRLLGVVLNDEVFFLAGVQVAQCIGEPASVGHRLRCSLVLSGVQNVLNPIRQEIKSMIPHLGSGPGR